MKSLNFCFSTPWQSIYVASLCSFVQALQFGLFFSSLWPYLKRLDPTVSESFFGYVVAIYSFGQCIASPLFGYWSNRINFSLIQPFSPLMLSVLSSEGNGVLLRAYASTASLSVDRSRAIGCVTAGIAVGLVIGPGLQALFTPLGEEGIELLFGFNVNMYKAPALLAAIVNVGGVLMMYFAFEERYLSVSTNIETLGSAYSMLMFDLSAPNAVRVNSISQAVQGVAAAVILLPFLFMDIGKRQATLLLFRCRLLQVFFFQAEAKNCQYRMYFWIPGFSSDHISMGIYQCISYVARGGGSAKPVPTHAFISLLIPSTDTGAEVSVLDTTREGSPDVSSTESSQLKPNFWKVMFY
ncbi:unnamed protein product [Heligmosomoides polygyrus]|uniref:MFS domain-containing protein n=1 Tax=Heligmosomoides polygyrus TaxID=6339 RepID=A0A183GQL8_HELPZ|nr:unnamed protein product [Heligmosomoides polygyrus]